MLVQLARSPCYPRYSVVVGEAELWDCDCATNNIHDTLELASQYYPNTKIIMFDDPEHYSNRSR